MFIKNILERFVFNPDNTIHSTPDSFNLPYENIYLSDEDSSFSSVYNKYHGWLIENNEEGNKYSNYIILYFHGNAGNISTRLNYIKKLYLLGFSILIFDYPGFGISDGIPNEESCISSAKLFYDYIHKNKKYKKKYIIFYGESIGGSIASSLAYKEKIDYLILHSTFVNIGLIIEKFLRIPSFVLNKIGFNTILNLQNRYKLNKLNKNFKTLIIHSKEDELIPFEHAIQLNKYSTHFYECKGNHCNPLIDKEFLDNLLKFINN